MSRPVLLVVLLTLSIAPRTTQAQWEFGLAAQTAWSDNEYLGDPDGWSLFLTKSLSGRLDLRGSYTWLDHQSRYIGTLPFVFQPPGPWSVRQFISGDAQIQLYEVILNYAIIEGSKMRLEVGGGMGYGEAQIELYGEQSGHSTGGGNNPWALSLNVQVLVKELIHAPIALRLAYQYRQLDAAVFHTDGFEPFTDFSLSSVQLGVLARF